MTKPIGGRGKQSPYPSKPMRVPEVLHPIVQEMIEQLYQTNEVPKIETCNGFSESDDKEVKEIIQAWISHWMKKAKDKEKQPRYKFLVDAIEELRQLINV